MRSNLFHQLSIQINDVYRFWEEINRHQVGVWMLNNFSKHQFAIWGWRKIGMNSSGT
jgi:hypothetical protein